MRNLSEVKKFLEDKGFHFVDYSFGQSYRHDGVLFFYKDGDFGVEHPSDFLSPYGENENIKFKPDMRGKAKCGKRIYHIVRLFPNPPEDNQWICADYYSTRKFQDEMVWSGRSFNDWSGIKIVKLPEIFDDLEELIE